MIPFANSYARLPERFFARLPPTPVAAPRLIKVNIALAEQLGLDPDDLTADTLSGNAVPEGAEPMALAYAGHQFGNFVPQLGDGRANLLGEVSGRDIQLKGAGRTPFSRGGDGRAALGPVLREYLISEAMHALGIPTTRALAAVTTGETVARETALPGAIVTRVASSHIRVGTFQYFAARQDTDGVRTLADYAIARHYPGVVGYKAFLEAVIARQAVLVARWLLVGFIHGVMNTDNCSIAGETIDYGPCAFMDEYDPATVFSSIDRQGRYAYGNQPRIAVWNLTRLAETLLPLLDDDEKKAVEIAQVCLASFGKTFEAAYFGGLRRKIGLLSPERDGDNALVQDLLKAMAENQADFTLTFRGLCNASVKPERDSAVRDLFTDPSVYDAWAVRWRQRLNLEIASPEARHAAMRATNPAYIPRNHNVETALNAAIARDDFAPFEELLAVVSKPFDDQPGFARYAAPPAPTERVSQTFCGT
ncbi:MAG: YdiU family protein [Rhodospirillales bacterium]